MKHDALREERARERFGRSDDWTRGDQILWDHPELRRLVRDYVDDLVRGGLPGDQGAAAREDLRAVLRARLRPAGPGALVRGGRVPAAEDRALPPDFTLATLAGIHDVRLSDDGRHAVVVVEPIRGFWVYTDYGSVVKGSLSQYDQDWDYLAVDAPHRLTLVRRDSGWVVADDFSLGWGANDVPSRLRRGGAPRDVCLSRRPPVSARR